MKVADRTLLCLCLIGCCVLCPAGEDDAIVVEASSLNRKERSFANSENERDKRQFIGWPGVLPIGPCFTSKGVLGRCTSFRQCYPYFKLPELNNWETWVLGMYDTCSYFTSTGRQMFGVCCTNPATVRPTQPPRPTLPPPTIGPPEPVVVEEEEEGHAPEPNPVNPIPPNWPPPIPTHSPDNTIPPLPTHPPSPGWPGLPESTTQFSTTKRPTKPTRPTYPTPPTRPTTKPSFPWQPIIPTQPPKPPAPPPPPQITTPEPVIPIDAACGAKSAEFDNNDQDQERIVGGHDAEPGEWPWIAALFNGGRQFCGGSLIDSTHVLTAAHCVAHMSSWDVARLTVRLGDYNIHTNTEVKHVEKKVKRVVRHRGFDARTLYNDIAILTLESPVPFSRTIKPICLPSGNAAYAGQKATVIGWGSLRESGPQPGKLQEVSIQIWTNSECRAKYGGAAPGGIVEHFLCAGTDNKDSCSGDSGGPLMINNGQWTQVGIVSWGIGCGKGQYPGVYTRVTHFMPWITKNLK